MRPLTNNSTVRRTWFPSCIRSGYWAAFPVDEDVQLIKSQKKMRNLIGSPLPGLQPFTSASAAPTWKPPAGTPKKG